jgi:hypothetical protein
VEQHYRDNRLNMIHEGTNGIQALDLLGRKVQMQDGKGLRLLAEAMRRDVQAALAAEGGDAELAARAAQLEEAVQRLERVTKTLVRLQVPSKTLANAHEYLNMAGHTCVAWMWLRQETAACRLLRGEAHGAEHDFLLGKRFTSRFFFAHELPKTRQLEDLLLSLDATSTDMKEEYF